MNIPESVIAAIAVYGEICLRLPETVGTSGKQAAEARIYGGKEALLAAIEGAIVDAESNGGVQTFQRDVMHWARKTFPNSSVESAIAHMKRELDEVIANPSDVIEWADVFLIFLHASGRAGHYFLDVLDAARRKHDINQKRTWGEPDAEGVVEHERARSQPGEGRP